MTKVRRVRSTRSKRRKTWQLQEAKAQFSELINEVVKGKRQTITKNGRPVAVILSLEEFEKFKQPPNTFTDFLAESPFSDRDLDLSRDKTTERDLDL